LSSREVTVRLLTAGLGPAFRSVNFFLGGSGYENMIGAGLVDRPD